MGISHFENGKNVTLQHVNTAIPLENMQYDGSSGLSWYKTFTVPANKKWTIYRIMGYRNSSGNIHINIRDKAGNYLKMDGIDPGLKIIIDKPFTVSSGWDIVVYFYNSGTNGNMEAYIMYYEEPE